MPLPPVPAFADAAHQPLSLSCHPTFTGGVQWVVQTHLQVHAAQPDPWLELNFELHGELDHLRLPPKTNELPADGLWNHTCAELFVRTPGSQGYQEFNFSPSGQWAAYRFSAERLRNLKAETEYPARPPTIHVRGTERSVTIAIHLPLYNLRPPSCRGEYLLGLSMVTEATNGMLTYWALSHPLAARPDFHHPGGCVLPLSLPYPLNPSVEEPR